MPGSAVACPFVRPDKWISSDIFPLCERANGLLRSLYGSNRIRAGACRKPREHRVLLEPVLASCAMSQSHVRQPFRQEPVNTAPTALEPSRDLIGREQAVCRFERHHVRNAFAQKRSPARRRNAALPQGTKKLATVLCRPRYASTIKARHAASQPRQGTSHFSKGYGVITSPT